MLGFGSRRKRRHDEQRHEWERKGRLAADRLHEASAGRRASKDRAFGEDLRRRLQRLRKRPDGPTE